MQKYYLGLSPSHTAEELFNAIINTAEPSIPTNIVDQLLTYREFVTIGYNLGGPAYDHALAAFKLHAENYEVYTCSASEDDSNDLRDELKKHSRRFPPTTSI